MVHCWPRWDLVTVLPAAVYGPPISARADGESAKRIKVCHSSRLSRTGRATLCRKIRVAVTIVSSLPAGRQSYVLALIDLNLQDCLEGAFWPAVPPFYLPVVDVDDVAALHFLAAVVPAASGRCAFHTEMPADIAAWAYLLRQGVPASS